MKRLFFALACITGMVFFAGCTQEQINEFLEQKPNVAFVEAEGYVSGNTTVLAGTELNFQIKVSPNAGSKSPLTHLNFVIVDVNGNTVRDVNHEIEDPDGESIIYETFSTEKASTYFVTATVTDEAGKVNIAELSVGYLQLIASEIGVFKGKLDITGGTVTGSAKNHAAIEAKGELIVTGGDVYATSSDDAINSGSNMILGGGRVCAISTGNDGLDANGNCYIQGALVYAVGSGTPEVAVDANTEDGYKLYVISGTLVAIGGLEGGAHLCQACYSANWNANTWYGLYQDGALALAFQAPSLGGNTLVVSTGGTTTLKSGVTASGTKIFGGMGATAATGGSDVTLSAYTAAGGMGGPGGGMGGPGGGPGFGR